MFEKSQSPLSCRQKPLNSVTIWPVAPMDARGESLPDGLATVRSRSNPTGVSDYFWWSFSRRPARLVCPERHLSQPMLIICESSQEFHCLLISVLHCGDLGRSPIQLRSSNGSKYVETTANRLFQSALSYDLSLRTWYRRVFSHHRSRQTYVMSFTEEHFPQRSRLTLHLGTIGRLRPYYLTVCNPVWANLNCTRQINTASGTFVITQ